MKYFRAITNGKSLNEFEDEIQGIYFTRMELTLDRKDNTMYRLFNETKQTGIVVIMNPNFLENVKEILLEAQVNV